MYDFDSNVNRFDKYSLKWNVEREELPMWVADMDFRVCTEIVDSMRDILNHGIFGYSYIPDEYYESIISWWRNRYHYEIKREYILHSCGVVPSISTIINTLSNKGDGILVQPPVYHVFYRCIKDNDRVVINNPLIYENNTYRVDFDDLENKLKHSKIMILCNPHNPVSKAFDKDTLRKIGEICVKHNVIVISDEIHCDITKDFSYTPFASLSDEIANITISAFSPHKTFNIADLHVSCLVIHNKALREIMEKSLRINHIATSNILGITASIAAYGHGRLWLNEMLGYIWGNEAMVRDFVSTHISNISIAKSNATYLLWLDCGNLMGDRFNNSSDLATYLRKETGLYVSSGLDFGLGGENFLRLNIATSKDRIRDCLNRLKNGIEAI